MNSTSSPLGIIILVVAVGFGCAGPSKKPTFNCIQPPPQDVKVNKAVFAEAAAKLEEIKLDGTLKMGFTNAVNVYYQPIGERNAAYNLFLNAIDCYMVRAQQNKSLLPLVERIVPELLRIVEQKWTATQGATLVMTERKLRILNEATPSVRASIQQFRDREWFKRAVEE